MVEILVFRVVTYILKTLNFTVHIWYIFCVLLIKKSLEITSVIKD